MSLLREFEMKSLKPWGAHVAEITTRFVKLNYVSEEDRKFLLRARQRNEAFMANVKSILDESVAKNTGIDAAVSRQAEALWAESETLNASIAQVLRHCNTPGASDAIRHGGRSSTPTRGRSATSGAPSSRATTPRRAPSPAPKTFEEIRTPKRQPSPARSGAAVTSRPRLLAGIGREEHRGMLEGIEELSRRDTLSRADLEWALSVFLRLYGDGEGQTQFQQWCAKLTKAR